MIALRSRPGSGLCAGWKRPPISGMRPLGHSPLLARRVCAAAVAIGLAAACHASNLDIDPASSRPYCDPDVPACLLASAKIDMDGKQVEIVQATNSALSLPDGGVRTATGQPPKLTNVPAPLTFSPDAPSQTFDLEWTDPTGSRFSHFLSLRPKNPTIRCLAPCCFGCWVTRRVFDKLTSGTTHVTITLTADPAQPADYVLRDYPVSSTDPTQDPFVVATQYAQQGNLLVGEPIDIPVHAEGSKNPGASPGPSGGGDSGSTGGGSCSCSEVPSCVQGGSCSTACQQADCRVTSCDQFAAQFCTGAPGIACCDGVNHKCYCAQTSCNGGCGSGCTGQFYCADNLFCAQSNMGGPPCK